MVFYLLIVLAFVAVANFQKNGKITGCRSHRKGYFGPIGRDIAIGYQGVQDENYLFKVGTRLVVTCYKDQGRQFDREYVSYCQRNGEWEPKPGKCKWSDCSVSDLLEKRNFQAVELTDPDVNNTGIVVHEKTAKAVCCGNKYPKDPKDWPYTFTCWDGTWLPKTECNDDQYAFCDVSDLVQKRHFVSATNVARGIEHTPYQLHGKNATAVCCGHKYPEDTTKWPYKFKCEHGKWLPEIKCNDDQYAFCDVNDLVEKNLFLAAKPVLPGIEDTPFQLHGKNATAVCCGRKFSEDPTKWPYKFVCEHGKWLPEIKCNDVQYAFCDVNDLVEKNFFLAAKPVPPGIEDTPLQLHGKNATAVCCGRKYPEDSTKWPYKFVCEHGKWLPEIECDAEF